MDLKVAEVAFEYSFLFRHVVELLCLDAKMDYLSRRRMSWFR